MERKAGREPNKRILPRVAALLLAAEVVVTGCTSPKPIDYNDPNLIFAGHAPWGNVSMYTGEDSCVIGSSPWGKATLCKTDNKITGNSAWGGVNLEIVDGHVTGNMPWGGADLIFTDNEVKGHLPWGNTNLKLEDHTVSGNLPFGSADLQLGEKFSSLTNTEVELGLLALMSDKT